MTSGWRAAPYFRDSASSWFPKTDDFVREKLGGGGGTVERFIVEHQHDIPTLYEGAPEFKSQSLGLKRFRTWLRVEALFFCFSEAV